MISTLTRRKFLWVAVAAASLLVLASPLTSCQRVLVGTTTDLFRTSPLTSSLNFNSFKNTVNSGSGSSALKEANSATVIGTSGSYAGKGLPAVNSDSSSASTATLTATPAPAAKSSGDSSSSIGISSSASSAGLRVFSNSACTDPVGNLNWGTISPGITATATIYVKNTGNSDSLTLSIQASNWNPTSASCYLMLSWNKQGTVLTPGQFTEATIALTVSSSITGITSFSVQILISGTD